MLQKKTFGLGALLTTALWKSNISLTLSQKEKSLAPKLTNWRPFILQNSNGCGAQFLSHTPQILEINQFFDAVKMVLLYLVKIYFSF